MEKDRRLEALELAQRTWAKTYREDDYTKLQKIELAKELHEYALFSLNQLGKIVRLPAVTLTRAGLQSNASGGRFDPQTLTTLIAMRKTKMLGERCPARLIEVCVEGGTSWSCAATLTGIAYSNYYKNVPAEFELETRALKLKPHDKDAIHKALNAGADSHLLAEQYGVHEKTVRKIHRAYGNV